MSTDKDADGIGRAGSEGEGPNIDQCPPNVTRRALLKMAAGAPLVLTFGMLASPLSRFFKPSMTPGNFFQASDFPEIEAGKGLSMADFPADLDFKLVDIKYTATVFGPAKNQSRVVPAVAVRLNREKIVAFSRLCPMRGCLMQVSSHSCCGCPGSKKSTCRCHMYSDSPVLVCPNHFTVYDLTRDGQIAEGFGVRPPRKFHVTVEGERIVFDGFEKDWIV